MTKKTAITSRSVERFSLAEMVKETQDDLAIEEPLEIRIDDQPVAITMRTPGHDVDLAAGFCLTESIVDDPDDLEKIEPCFQASYGNVVTVRLSEEASKWRTKQIAQARRETFLTSSCGLCGKQSIDLIHQKIKPCFASFRIAKSTILTLPSKMREAQKIFNQTGGLHAAGIFSASGQLLILREDVGRHNAVDKVVGHALLTGQLPLNQAMLLISGRASFEIMQKAAMAGISLVIAVSAPTSLAVDFAKQSNMTLVGFLKKTSMNIYHHSGHLADE